MNARASLFVLGFGALALASARPLAAQLIIGQYENEAPFRTWNTFPFVSAASLGRGETSLALASDGAAAWSNPALLAGLPRFTVTAGGSYQAATAFRYAYINTGVLTSNGPLEGGRTGLDFGAVSGRWGNWALALAYAEFESYDRPAALAEAADAGVTFFSNSFTQSGSLRGISISLARKLGRFSVGVTVLSLTGTLDRSWTETRSDSGYTLSDRITQKFSGLAVQGGVSWEASDSWTWGATVRFPFAKKSGSESLLRYQAPAGATDIQIRDSASDVLRQPWIIGLGTAIRPAEGLTLAADALYYRWSAYAPEFFGEAQSRDFRDVVRVGAGAEYVHSFRLFGLMVRNPVRAGLVYDPQPMNDPRSSYVYFTFGTGLISHALHIDLGGSIGRESGSGKALSARRFLLTVGFFFGERP